MLVMSNHYFEEEVTGVMKGKTVANEWWYGLSLRGHILLGLVAIFTGPFQLMSFLRNRFIKLHRGMGYIYAISVLISSLCGLLVAQFPMGGMITQVGFSLLAIFWLFSLLKAVQQIRKGEIKQHQKWMFINYGLTFAAITQRTLLLFPLFLDVDFMNIYRLSAWLPWMLNTAVAVFLYNRVKVEITL